MLANQGGNLRRHDRALRLSFVLSELRLSGGVRVVLEFAQGLAARGHRVMIVSSIDPDDPASLPPPPGVELVAVTQRINRRKVHTNVGLALALARKTPPSDFVIATHTPTVPSVLLACNWLGRGRPAWLFMDYAEMFADRPVERAIFHVAPRLIAPTFCLSANSAVDLWRLGQHQTRVVGLGIRHDVFVTQPEDGPRDHNEVVYIGDARPRKGLADVIAAMQLVRRAVPSARLTIISRERLVVPPTVPHEIVHLPSDAEVARRLAQCGVFVSPSWAEGFGLPALEAMACGAPVVVADSRGVREYAAHEVNCLLVPPRDPKRLAEAIIRLLDDPSLARRLGRTGPATAARFTWKAAVDRLEHALLEHRN